MRWWRIPRRTCCAVTCHTGQARMTKDEEAGANRAMWLICRVSTRVCALPLDAVVETMRPLVVEPVAGAPGFVSGLSIVRGEPIPVVDAARLLGTEVAS